MNINSLRLTLSGTHVGGASEESTGHVRAYDVQDRGPLLNSTDYFRMMALCQQRRSLLSPQPASGLGEEQHDVRARPRTHTALFSPHFTCLVCKGSVSKCSKVPKFEKTVVNKQLDGLVLLSLRLRRS